MSRVRCYLRRPDGSPMPYGATIWNVVNDLRAASDQGVGLYLSAERVRALDYSIIRDGEMSGYDCTTFREMSWAEFTAPAINQQAGGRDE